MLCCLVPHCKLLVRVGSGRLMGNNGWMHGPTSALCSSRALHAQQPHQVSNTPGAYLGDTACKGHLGAGKAGRSWHGRAPHSVLQ